MRLYLGAFVVFTTLLLTNYFPYNHKFAINATARNPYYNVHHITACALSLFDRKFLTTQIALDFKVKKVCTKLEI